MNIFANTVVSITFKLYDAQNLLLEETPEPIAYLHGGHSGIFPKVEKALEAKKAGDQVSVTLEPEDAFGDYDPQLIRLEAVDKLPPDVVVGGFLVAEENDEEPQHQVEPSSRSAQVCDTPAPAKRTRSRGSQLPRLHVSPGHPHAAPSAGSQRPVHRSHSPQVGWSGSV